MENGLSTLPRLGIDCTQNRNFIFVVVWISYNLWRFLIFSQKFTRVEMETILSDITSILVRCLLDIVFFFFFQWAVEKKLKSKENNELVYIRERNQFRRLVDDFVYDRIFLPMTHTGFSYGEETSCLQTNFESIALAPNSLQSTWNNGSGYLSYSNSLFLQACIWRDKPLPTNEIFFLIPKNAPNSLYSSDSTTYLNSTQYYAIVLGTILCLQLVHDLVFTLYSMLTNIYSHDKLVFYQFTFFRLCSWYT